MSVPTPTAPGWGFFCVLLPVPCGTALLPSLGGEEEERGKQAVVPPAALLPSSLYSIVELEPPHERREPHVLGLLDSVQAHQYTWEQSHGSPPVLGCIVQET